MVSPDVVCVASWNTDLVCRIERPMRKGETVLGHDFEQLPGGKGSNAAIACARQGARVALIARIGDDDFGRNGLALWSREGIDTRGVVVAPGERSGIAQILIYDDGDNSIAVVPGAGAGLNDAHVRASAQSLSRCKVVMASNEVPLVATLAAFQMAREAGAAITLLNPAPAKALPDELLALCDVLTPNEAEACELAGLSADGDVDLAARRLLARGPSAVVITLGAQGCGVWQKVTTTEDSDSDAAKDTSQPIGSHITRTDLPGWSVSPVADTVGAGDTFTGALAAALARGLNVLEAARWANAAAALSVLGHGAIGGMPTLTATGRLILLQNPLEI
jgi:ribokinase